jgi:hypothetical protein
VQEGVGQIAEQKNGDNAGNDVIHLAPPQNRSQALVKAQQTAKNSTQIKT